MRNADEVQRVHDQLVAVILGEVPLDLDSQDLQRLTGAADVLCWVLQHGHNDTFELNLKKLEQSARAAGFVLQRKPPEGGRG
jgi:hypothetical protein